MAQSTPSELLPLLESMAALRARDGGPATPVVAESTVAAGLMPPLHVHEADEAVHVLEGSLMLYAGDETVRLSTGRSFVVRGGVPHTHRALSPRVRLLTMSLAASAGLYEDFVRALGTPLPAAANRPVAEDEATLNAFAAPSGIEVLGPPGTLPTAVERPAS